MFDNNFKLWVSALITTLHMCKFFEIKVITKYTGSKDVNHKNISKNNLLLKILNFQAGKWTWNSEFCYFLSVAKVVLRFECGS